MITMLYNIIYSKIFYVFLYVMWQCDNVCDMCDQPVRITCNVTSLSLNQVPIRKIRKTNKEWERKIKETKFNSDILEVKNVSTESCMHD